MFAAGTFTEQILTVRLILRRPRLDDARAIYERYASNPAVTRHLAWPTHASMADTEEFLRFADAGWRDGNNFSYLIERRDDGLLLGSTGLTFETPYRASTGYVLAEDAWGQGFATEALAAILNLAFDVPGVARVYALCHAEHQASARVMEKCAMVREGVLESHMVLPNLSPIPCDVLCYARTRRT